MSNSIIYLTTNHIIASGVNQGMLERLRVGINPNVPNDKQNVQIMCLDGLEAPIPAHSDEESVYLVVDEVTPTIRELANTAKGNVVDLTIDPDFDIRGLVEPHNPKEVIVFITDSIEMATHSDITRGENIVVIHHQSRNSDYGFATIDEFATRELIPKLVTKNLQPTHVVYYSQSGEMENEMIAYLEGFFKFHYSALEIPITSGADFKIVWCNIKDGLREAFAKVKNLQQRMKCGCELIEPMKFGEAFDKMMAGEIDITPLNLNGWGQDSFVTVTPGTVVEANKFWAPANRDEALKRGGEMEVHQNAMQTDSTGTQPFIPTWPMMRAKWIDKDHLVIIKNIQSNRQGDILLEFGVSSLQNIRLGNSPLWLIYDGLCIDPSKHVVIVGGSDDTNIRTLSPTSYRLCQVIGAAFMANYNRDTRSIMATENHELAGLAGAIDISSINSKAQVYEWIEAAQAERGPENTSFIIDNVDLAGLMIEGENIVDIVTQHLHDVYLERGVTWASIDLDDEVNASE